MPKGKRISIATQREWLEQYERGKPIDQIAREAGKSPRTVRARLAKARDERDQALLRGQLSRTAYELHIQDLLGAAETIGERAVDWHPPGLFPLTDLEQRLLHEGLVAHIPKSPLWQWCRVWEENAKRLGDLEHRLKEAVATFLREQASGSAEPLLHTNVDGFSACILRLLANRTEGRESSEEWYKEEESGSRFSLSWGAHLLADKVQSRDILDSVKMMHGALIKEPQRLGKDLVSAYLQVLREWQEAKRCILEEVALQRLRRYLPGECRICSGKDSLSTKGSLRAKSG